MREIIIESREHLKRLLIEYLYANPPGPAETTEHEIRFRFVQDLCGDATDFSALTQEGELREQVLRYRGRISALLSELRAQGTTVNGRICFCHPPTPDSRTSEEQGFMHSEECERAWGVLREEAMPNGSLDEIVMTAEEEDHFTPNT